MDTDVQQMLLVKEEALEEQCAGTDQQVSEHLQIKEEKEELWTSLDGEHLHLKEETDGARFLFMAISIKREDDEMQPLFSQLHQQQMEDREVPTSNSADQMPAESGGGAETSGNPDLNLHDLTSDSSETEVSGDDKDDVNLDSELSNSRPEPGDRDDDWRRRISESDVKTVNKSLSCPKCGKQFLQKRSLQKHVRVTSHSAIRSSGCLVKTKCVGVKQHVDSCRKVQTELKSLSCDDCGKIFKRKSNLNRHRSVHTGQKPFACELCGQTFSQKSNLNNHMRVHTGQKPFKCELCGQRFSQNASLKRHMRVHTGQKPFVCELCRQRFSHKANLNKHMRVHTGQKPFVCELCGQQFSQKETVKTHMRVHTGWKPFVCELCGKRFSKRTYLNNHMRVHTGQKPFSHELCGQIYKRRNHLSYSASQDKNQEVFHKNKLKNK